MTTPPQRGGHRPGAGRRAGTGTYGESTQRITVPESQVPAVVAYLAAFRKVATPEEQESGATMAVDPRPLAIDPPKRRIRRGGSSVPAGFPSPADDYIEGALDLNDHLIVAGHRDATFVIRVVGWSMVGAGIHDGDEVMVDRAIKPVDGHVVVAVVNGELTIKRLRIRKGKPVLVPENPHFAERRFEDVNGDVLEIWGVATRVLHKL